MSKSLTMNPAVTQFIIDLKHPLEDVITSLRSCILQGAHELSENIKWNAPNYTYQGEDRITMKLYPPKQIQLIFHRGAKRQTQPPARLISDATGLLVWKENDRAVLSISSIVALEAVDDDITTLVNAWIQATKD